MKIIVCGSRNWNRLYQIRGLLWAVRQRQAEARQPLPLIITGGARGADACAHDNANDQGFPTQVMHANWGTHGKAAGPIRNAEMLKMLDDKNTDEVFAFRMAGQSKGTDHMISIARKAGFKVTVFHELDNKIDTYPAVLSASE